MPNAKNSFSGAWVRALHGFMLLSRGRQGLYSWEVLVSKDTWALEGKLLSSVPALMHWLPLWGPSVESRAAPGAALPKPVRASYLLVLGPLDMGGIGLCPSAGHIAKAAVQLRPHPTWAAVGLGAHLLSCLLLFVLLPFQVLAVGLRAESEGGLRGACAHWHRSVPSSSPAGCA